MESWGFLLAVTVRDSPIRDKVIDLVVRRCRWQVSLTDKCFMAPYNDVKQEGTRYQKLLERVCSFFKRSVWWVILRPLVCLIIIVSMGRHLKCGTRK